SAIAQCAPQPFSERLHEPKTTAAESRWQRQLVRARLCGRIAQIQFGRASVLVSHYFVGKVRLVSLAPPNWSEQTFGQHALSALSCTMAERPIFTLNKPDVTLEMTLRLSIFSEFTGQARGKERTSRS